MKKNHWGEPPHNGGPPPRLNRMPARFALVFSVRHRFRALRSS